MDRLPFAKPERHIDPTLLRDYVRLHAQCEVDGCRRRPAPEPHHIKPRALGRDDRPENLLRLCGRHHWEAHLLGGRRWFAAYRDRLLPEAQTKVARALGLTEGDR
jgi:hypothetical protein